MHILAKMALDYYRAGNKDIALQMWNIATQILRQESAQ
jgi:hypothetical protein